MKSQQSVQVTALPMPSSKDGASRLLQRKCECGGAAGLAGECTDCREKRFTGQRPLVAPPTPTNVAPPTRTNVAQPARTNSPRVSLSAAGGSARADVKESRLTYETSEAIPAYLFSRIPVRPAAPAPVQPKLTVSQPGDEYEREADRVAEHVMRLPDASARLPAAGVTPINARGHLQRACSSCRGEAVRDAKKDEEEEAVQAKEMPGQTPTVGPRVASSLQSLRGGGQQLPSPVRDFFEPRFGHDFSRVRIHTDATAARTASDVRARAFTSGNDIVFGAGQYAPTTEAGRKLLAHELTHVVQQVPHIARQPAPPAAAAEPKCNKGNPEGKGQNLKPLVIDGITYTYLVWGTWQQGDSLDSFTRRAIKAWIPKRFGNLDAALRQSMFDFMMSGNIVPLSTANLTPQCQYTVPITSNAYYRMRQMSGEIKKELEAKKAAEAAKKAAEEGSGAGAKDAAAPAAAEGAKPNAAAVKPKEGDAPKSGGGGLLKGAVDESKKASQEPATPLRQDWSVLTDAKLAKQYLELLKHFTNAKFTPQDTTAAADGLTETEILSITGQDSYLQLLTGLYTQNYKEFQTAKGSSVEDFFKLEEVIFEQFTRGNPTAVQNNLQVGYSSALPAESKILGIVGRGSGWLLYDSNGIPLPGFGGVGMRDKGYIGARQPTTGVINLADIEDEALRNFLNSLRQTFTDPMRMTQEAAEVYFNNVEMVNRKVRDGLAKEVWNKFEDMLPFFVGFLAGELLANFLMRVPNPYVAGAGLALKVLLKAAGYVMQLELAESALARVNEVAWHLSRVEVKDGKISDELSAQHLEKAAKPLRDLVADIALMAATVGFIRLLRGLKGSERKGKLKCWNPCDITEGTGEPAKVEAKPGEGAKVEVKPGEAPKVEAPKTPAPNIEQGKAAQTAAAKKTPIPGDADYKGPQQPKSWRLTDEGMGAHMVERQNVRGRPGMTPYDQPNTPRYYPAGGPENAGQAHIRLHQASSQAGIARRGGNPGLSDTALADRYRSAYADPMLEGIRGDLRTPDGKSVIAKDVTPLQALEALLKWGEQQKVSTPAAPPAATPPPPAPPSGGSPPPPGGS